MPWHNQRTYGFVRTSTEAHDNATMCMDILSTLGWGKAAVCAALGNFEAESNYNPWRWQSEVVLPAGDSRIGIVCGNNTAHAYGIFQSDPAANYIYRDVAQDFPGFGPNYSNQAGSENDGTAQMHYLDWVCTQYSTGACGGWNASYLSSIPFSQFKPQNDLSQYSISQLTKIFHDGYERSAGWSSTGSTRIAAAGYWWDYFSGYVPPGPEPPGPVITPVPAWLLIRNKNMNGILKKNGRWFPV